MSATPGATSTGSHEEIFLDRHVGKYFSSLRNLRDSKSNYILGRRLFDAFPQKINSARRSLENAGYCVEQCRFAGAVRSQQGHQLPLVDGHGHIVQHGNDTIGYIKIIDGKHISVYPLDRPQ